MALLAQNDWQPPIARAPSPPRVMDPRSHPHLHPHPPPPPSSSSLQPSPDNSSRTHTTPSPPPTASYPLPPAASTQVYPPQQPWQPSPQAPAFYPAYPAYFPQQPPLPHQHHPHAPPAPYFDPNQHFAQWAYQQMMFNAQAHAQFHVQQQQQQQHPMLPSDFVQHQRTRSSTPPQQQQQQQQQPPSDFYQAQTFHPYAGAPRRAARQGSSSGSTSSVDPPQPPYARNDAAGSSSSINSASTGRSRKGSNPTAPPNRDRDRPSAVKSAPAPVQEVRRPTKPSPLGQANFSTSEQSSRPLARPTSSGTVRPVSPPTPRQEPTPRSSISSKRLSISKDDSQLGDPVPVPSATMVRSGGLKGRLRRALSFNAASTLDEASEGDDGKLNSRRKALANASKVNAAATAAAAAAAASSSTSPDNSSDPGSPPTPTGPSPLPSTGSLEPSLKGKSRARRAASLFNTKLNASTDNISLSSTVSSASVMIRKLGGMGLGGMGRLARKNSLMGITGLFKDKDKLKDSEATPDGSKGKGKKGATAVPSVTHATVEVDRGSSSEGPEISGLSPAARLARQHTIRSNEEAARQKAAEEARARDAVVAAASAAGGVGGAPVPVWERGTAPRSARRGVIREDDYEDGVGSDGEDSGSGSGSEDGTYEAHRNRGWEDEEEDVTIRIGGPLPQQLSHREEDDAWAVGLRRSIERTRRPAKGILKNASSYDQEALLSQAPTASFARVRSNSYNQSPHNHNEPGPLARIPSPDPDHIDGLHRPNGTSTPTSSTPSSVLDSDSSIPPFTFEDHPALPRPSSPDRITMNTTHHPQPSHGLFNLTNMNSSAPALSTTYGHPVPPPLTHRAATTPAKRLAFAANLSIYDTFSPHVYDRRSEPATCNRLTPALAQRIKEELNSYKMEEMEVHAASRVHTQFFV